MVAARIVPSLRLLVGGLEARCGVCRGVLLVNERTYCAECKPTARRRALVYLSAATPHPSPVGAA